MQCVVYYLLYYFLLALLFYFSLYVNEKAKVISSAEVRSDLIKIILHKPFIFVLTKRLSFDLCIPTPHTVPSINSDV